MAYPSKIVDRAEVRNWILEGRTYRWMRDEYRRKYHIDISEAAFSNFRALQGLPGRTAQGALKRIIPWKVAPQHRNRGWHQYLYTAAKLEEGKSVRPERLSAFQSWWERMEAGGSVVDYFPDTDEGFFPVARRPGIDKGYIREPDTESV